MEMKGWIVSGLGEGGLYVKKYSRYFLEKLGFEPYPGTLNVKVAKPPVLKNPLLITPEEGGLFPVECFDAIINSKVRGAIVRPVKTAHQKDILEIIAPLNIKEYFNLKEGDSIMVRV